MIFFFFSFFLKETLESVLGSPMMAGFDGMELNPGPLCAVGLHYSFITCALGAGFQHCDRLFIKDPNKFWCPVRLSPRRKISFSFKASQVKLSLSLSRCVSQQNSGMPHTSGSPAETGLLPSFGLVLAFLLFLFLAVGMQGLAELVSAFQTNTQHKNTCTCPISFF